jgi:hypothetical protein
MYENYPKEMIEKIKELGLYGKTPREIMLVSVDSCNDIIRGLRATDTEYKKKVGEIQDRQIKLMEKLYK